MRYHIPTSDEFEDYEDYEEALDLYDDAMDDKFERSRDRD
jgi:hypothetical protein